MKKKVFATLLLAGMVLGTGQAAFAEEATNYETYDNQDGSLNEQLKDGLPIPVQGTLGDIDNTNPDANLPEGDARWLNVTIPTVVFFNLKVGDNKKIDSEEYTVTNNSARAINMTLANFSNNDGKKIEAIEKLSLIPLSGSGTDIDVVTGGIAIGSTSKLLDKVAEKEGVYKFKYTGDVIPEKLNDIDTKAKEGNSKDVFYTMNLKFEVLGKDGNSVIKK